MPRVIVKLCLGKSDDRKWRLTDADVDELTKQPGHAEAGLARGRECSGFYRLPVGMIFWRARQDSNLRPQA